MGTDKKGQLEKGQKTRKLFILLATDYLKKCITIVTRLKSQLQSQCGLNFFCDFSLTPF